MTDKKESEQDFIRLSLTCPRMKLCSDSCSLEKTLSINDNFNNIPSVYSTLGFY